LRRTYVSSRQLFVTRINQSVNQIKSIKPNQIKSIKPNQNKSINQSNEIKPNQSINQSIK